MCACAKTAGVMGFEAGLWAWVGYVADAGGHATLVRAPETIRAAIDVFEPLASPLRRVTQGLKAEFDPKGLLNPGRMYAGI